MKTTSECRVERDIAWAAGIIEGEGCLSMFDRKRPSGKVNTQCAIHCEMTDKDVIERLQKVLGCGNINYRSAEGRGNRKPSWILSIQRQQDIFDTLIKIGPYLAGRRREKASRIFSHLEERVV